MNHAEQKLTQLRTLRLSDEARIRMREELISYAELHAVTSSAPARRSPFSVFSFRMTGALAVLALVVGSVGGTAFAAGAALPGDMLYSVKTGITEPLQTALIPSDQGKAAWHAILAERRLNEAVQLAANDSLTPALQEDIAANLDLQVHASEESAARLERSGDALSSLALRSDLEARLTAHEQILSTMDAHFAEASSSSSTHTALALKDLLSTVAGHKAHVEGVRLALEHALVPPAAKEAIHASSTTTVLARAQRPQAHRYFAAEAPAARIAEADAARAEEVDTILAKHAVLLAAFLPEASSTLATSTEATTTASTTIETEGTEGEDK